MFPNLWKEQGKPLTNDPQMFLGHLTLHSSGYKDPIIPLQSWFPSLFVLSIISSLCGIITTSCTYLFNVMASLFCNFYIMGQNLLTLDNTDDNTILIITSNMICLHLTYNTIL